jgi:hypothetical protein
MIYIKKLIYKFARKAGMMQGQEQEQPGKRP